MFKKSCLSFLICILPISILWIICYIPHYLNVIDLTSKWYGLPYVVTSGFSIALTTVIAAINLNKIWE